MPDEPDDPHVVSTYTSDDGGVCLVLPGMPLVEFTDGRLVTGVTLTPAMARELAVHLIERAMLAETRKEANEQTSDEENEA